MTARVIESESRQSESDSSHDDASNLVNIMNSFTITYPIDPMNCSICGDALTSNNLKIREHIMNIHNIHSFKYQCRLCKKEYSTISSIKSHAPACKRLNNNQQTSTNSNTISTSDNKGAPDQLTTIVPASAATNPFQCTECLKSNQVFIASDNKKLVNHMRTIHTEEYERSKFIATKRVAWSSNEDHILAVTEIQLKSIQKGQLLERLHAEYNKLTTNSNAPQRSKEAIRGRRQQKEYKDLLISLQSSNIQTSRTLPMNISNNNTTGAQVPPSPVSIVPIKDHVENLMKNNNPSLNNNIITAVNAFLDNNSSIDILNLSLHGLIETIISSRHDNNGNNNRTRGNNNVNPNRTPAKNHRRQEKARRHGYYQSLFYKNKQRLIAEVLDGAASNIKPPPIDETEKYYRDIWCNIKSDVAPYTSKPPPNHDIIFAPIMKSDILTAVKETNKQTAAGLDGIRIGDCYNVILELTIAFNIWLSVKKIPSDLKKNKTILIPKGNSDLNNLKNWRPITISSVILRLYNKIMGKRINTVFTTSDNQVGFKPVNGCGINIAWLHSLLKHARLHKNNLYACLIDVSKAFDTVSHQSIIRALRRNSAPEELIDLILDQYTNTTTMISYDTIKSNEIEIKSGVKQGDPLSSILFNLIIDELFDVLGNDYGYSINNFGQTNARCFADDLCLISSSRIGMGELINKTSIFLAERGLTINPSKCISIGLAKAYKGKKSKIEMDSLFKIDNTPIPMLGFTNNTTRYLGIRFTSLGALDFNQTKESIINTLDKIIKLPLKAECKVELLRTYVIPRFIFELIHTEICPSTLKKIDIIIRRAIRRILYLPVSLSNEFFYLPLKEGGLQFPMVHEVVGLAKIKLYKKISLMNDPLLKHLIYSQKGSMNERFILSLGLGGTFNSNEIMNYKERLMKNKRNTFATKIHGVGNEIFSTCPLSNRWLQGNTRTVKTRTYIGGIKLRTNSYETKVTTTRGLPADKVCRKCKLGDESLMHILQRCVETKPTRYARHHRICKRVTQKLNQQGYQVYSEKSFPDPNNNGHWLRPDIIAVKEEKALVLDVSVVYEVTGASFNNAYQWKREKYEVLSSDILKEFKCNQIETHGLIIGARGSFFHRQLPIWYNNIGFNSSELRFLAIGCMEDSLKILKVFNFNGRLAQSS